LGRSLARLAVQLTPKTLGRGWRSTVKLRAFCQATIAIALAVRDEQKCSGRPPSQPVSDSAA
jgi:hypothetical protein